MSENALAELGSADQYLEPSTMPRRRRAFEFSTVFQYTDPFRRPLVERFIEKIIPEPNSGCWLWIGARSIGYGEINSGVYGAHPILAHRISYLLFKGEIPIYLEIDHLCKTKCCVNPDHLELVTHQENTLRGSYDMITRENVRVKTHCHKGHPFSGENLRLYKGHKYCRACMREYNRAYRRGEI